MYVELSLVFSFNIELWFEFYIKQLSVAFRRNFMEYGLRLVFGLNSFYKVQVKNNIIRKRV